MLLLFDKLLRGLCAKSFSRFTIFHLIVVNDKFTLFRMYLKPFWLLDFQFLNDAIEVLAKVYMIENIVEFHDLVDE